MRSKEHGVDFFDTFSPVVRPATIRIVLTLALTYGWSLRQLDVQKAFLHGELLETVYMQQPPGFVDPSNPNHVCLLSKALYCLKQSPRAWFHTLSMTLLDLGFIASKYDPSLFVFRSKDRIMVLLVYVDDIILTGNDPGGLQELIGTLQNRFAIKDLGGLHRCAPEKEALYFLVSIDALFSLLCLHILDFLVHYCGASKFVHASRYRYDCTCW